MLGTPRVLLALGSACVVSVVVSLPFLGLRTTDDVNMIQ